MRQLAEHIAEARRERQVTLQDEERVIVHPRRGSRRLPALHHSSGLSGVGKGSSIVESPKPARRPCDGAKRVDVENQLRGQSVY